MTWLRIESDEIRSIRVTRLAQALSVPPVVALGHLTALFGAVLQHRPDGQIGNVPPDILALWGAWTGDASQFLTAVTATVTRRNRIDGWDVITGELANRRASNAGRQKRWRDKQKAEREAALTSSGKQSDVTRHVRPSVPFRS
jgi:hypothetical protein